MRERTATSITPICPRCGADVTDDPISDLYEGENFVICNGCGVPVRVVVRTIVMYDVIAEKS